MSFLPGGSHSAPVKYSIGYFYNHNCLIIADAVIGPTPAPTASSSSTTAQEDDTTTPEDSTDPTTEVESTGRRKRQSGTNWLRFDEYNEEPSVLGGSTGPG